MNMILVQDILKQIKAGEAQTEDFILDNINETITARELIPKNEHYKCMKALDATATNAVKVGINKLDTYYTKTDDSTMYTVATDNKWKHSFIHYAKETILNIYNANYAPTTADGRLEDINNDDENDEFLDQLFAKMARDYLAITATSVPVEQFFLVELIYWQQKDADLKHKQFVHVCV
ncbi:hypothetical protein RhiirA4_458181 [Rhizophagus irregularis]|uniref:Uncharacterized protein n=1 Tax=Rhizophagus irregularis TaxID=588596 RepID=A0A2I1GBM6_9GLOM|nr:hypothetical protein RhiirA4_458181 [Rhizophagus irregularis]